MSSTASAVVTGLIVCVLMSTPSTSAGCSIFALFSDDGPVYGQNLDWHSPLPGNVVVNTRGIAKSILPWKGSGPVPFSGKPVTWRSRYGSVTFTCYGRDFIEGGMNEAGLIIDEASLTAVYPPDDGRPGVSCAQWMQYQLDNFATVDEVIVHLGDLRPDGEGWHYLIADVTGACAVIEYPDGKPAVYTGSDVRVCAATNTTHEQALSHIHLDLAFGGEIDIAAGADSYGRFVRMAALIRNYDPDAGVPAVDYALHILDEVSCAMTLRSVVYDAGEQRVYYSTPDNPEVRWLDFDHLDFSPRAAVKVLNVESGGPGDVFGLLEDYTVEGNRAIVTATLGPGSREALDTIAEHPTSPVPPLEED
jgi:choloylglycine hydrolase